MNIEEEYEQNEKNEERACDNPNIFNKLIAGDVNLLEFTITPINSTLLHCDPEYRIYELPMKN